MERENFKKSREEMRAFQRAEFPPVETYDRGQIAALGAIQALKEVLLPERIEEIIDKLSEASGPNEVSRIIREEITF